MGRGRAAGPKVLLPRLGRPYGRALEAGELRLALEDGHFVLRYFDWKFPVDPRPGTWCSARAWGACALAGREHDVVRRLLQVMAAVRALPPRSDENPVAAAERCAASRRSCARWRSCESSRTAPGTWSRRWPG